MAILAFVRNLKERTPLIEQNKQKVMFKVLNILQQKSLRAIEKAKNQILAEKIESKKARKALEYYVQSWNDTTHPGILALACEAVGGNIAKAMPMQIAMLYLTAAMDLHDDVIDQSEIKDAKPTVFGKYGKDISLLLGNAMMIKGFTCLCDYSKIDRDTFEAIICAIRTYLFDVGNAHLLEIDAKGNVDISPERYLPIIEKKARIIEAHTKIGAIIGNGSSDEIEDLAQYGKILGILIGLREEFIDVFEPKELQTRMKNEILPLPLLYAFKNSKIRSQISNILSKPKISEEEAEKVVEYVFQNENVKELKKYILDLARKARDIASKIGNERIERNLILLVDGALEDL